MWKVNIPQTVQPYERSHTGQPSGGQDEIDGKDIYGKDINVDVLRKNVGMVFQRPNPFPKSIYENVAYGLRVNGVKDESFISERVEQSLRGAALWDEVKDKLKKVGLRPLQEVSSRGCA